MVRAVAGLRAQLAGTAEALMFAKVVSVADFLSLPFATVRCVPTATTTIDVGVFLPFVR